MIVINDVQVFLVPMEFKFFTYLGYVYNGSYTIVWDSSAGEYYLSSFSFEEVRELYGYYQ